MFDPQTCANHCLSQIDKRHIFLAPLEGMAEQCWQILLVIYSARILSLDRVAEACRLSQSLAARYLNLLGQYGYVEQAISGGEMAVELTSSTRRQIEALLAEMAYPASADGS